MSDTKLYRSKYEAYPFLCDPSNKVCCDFELLTDEMASQTGLLRSLVKDKALQDELLWVCELIYNLNPSLRTRLTITQEEIDQLFEYAHVHKEKCGARCKLFVLTQGSTPACIAHILRVQGKKLVRLIYKHIELGNEVSNEVLDIANLLSGYFFYLALYLNECDSVDEVEYISRNY